ncbi:MAG: murein DD-endopeptidase MepM [Pasteurellaceae bacterium]|nr:murein DD-endopeptidase MepM [Pasteurellaceae bacterium]
MKYVVFARDRRRKKIRIKALMAIMVIVSLFIGAMLMLQQEQQTNEIPITLSEIAPTIADKHAPKQAESTVAAVDSVNSPSLSAAMLQVDAPADKTVKSDTVSPPKVDIPVVQSSTDHAVTYLDIQDGELDEPESKEPIDEKATSYEDDFVAEDDIDDETIQRIQAEAAKAQEDKLSPEAEQALDSFLDVADQAIRIQNQFSYTVARGDKLQDVLAQSGIGAATAAVLERKLPQLASLRSGQQFYWILGKDGELEYMNWLVSEKEEKIFERTSKNQFSVQTIQKKSVWKQDVVKGTLNGSFQASLKAQGLSNRQINQLVAGLQWQVPMNKLKKGDKFVILVKREYIDDKVTDLGNVEAIHLFTGNKSYYAIQADNGRYYSRNGETLGKGFARYPLQARPRISSPFNPRRLHPVTRRVAPHRGVDFAVKSGTPVIAPADGVVEHVAYQANGAGRYIKIRHGRQYTTVYMHLSRALVKPGQTVKKGERIALSGNTGRSTGPHLHYEFHINGHPVNPMTVKLPGTGSSMPEKERKAFLTKARAIEAKLKL